MKNLKKRKYPEVYGLVLAGGKSSRMGRDKGLISYHGIPQREYLFKILEEACVKAFLSVQPGQIDSAGTALEHIEDRNEYRGPFNGMLSAHAAYPEAAWLVLACDMPMVSADTVEKLIESRNPSCVATALATRESGLPEPLAAIWEPHGLMEARRHLEEAISSCPRKFLINSNTQLVYPESDLELANANSESDYEDIMAKLGQT